MIPPRRKLEKFVMATALRVRNAAKMTALWVPRKADVVVNVAIKADKITTRLVTEPSTNPATTSMIGSFFNRRLSHSLPSFWPCGVN